MENFTSYKILPEQNLIICNYQGMITVKEVIHLNQIFINDQDYNSAYHVLIDFRNSSAIGFRLDISDYVSFFKKSVALKSKVMVGILYSTPNQEFLLKVYKGFGKLLNLEIENFRQTEPCLKWMNFSESEASLIMQTLTAIKSTSADLKFS